MLSQSTFFRSLAVFVGALTLGSAQAGVITEIRATPGGPGEWFEADMRGGGLASIEDLSGAGGDLESNAPLPNGAALLQTGFDNGDKAEIGVFDTNFTTAGDMAGSNGFSLSYSFHKESVIGGNLFAAPSIKLSFYDPTYIGDGFVTLVYEPSWNVAPTPGVSTAVTPDTWTTANIDANNGLFWQTGGFGQVNSAGGPPLKTLADWSTTFDAGFANAELVLLSVGVGTYNQGQMGYFDDVRLETSRGAVGYDFEAVPEPSSLAVFAVGGLMGLGIVRRRRSAKEGIVAAN